MINREKSKAHAARMRAMFGELPRERNGKRVPRDPCCADDIKAPAEFRVLDAADRQMQIDLDTAVSVVKEMQPPEFEGCGIVMSAGGAIYFVCAYVCIWLLRNHGCKLPIEVWYIGREEMDRDMVALLESFGDVQCIDATDQPGPLPRIHHGWQNKLFAIQRSRFREVLFLDADQVPVKDPAYLFDAPEFQDKGAAFWDDLQAAGWAITRTAFEVARLPIPAGQRLERPDCPTDYRPFETGQLLIDKSRPEQWRALALALWIAERSDYWWTGEPWLIYGDKDAFYLAWRRLGVPFAMPETRVSWVGGVKDKNGEAGGAFMQHDFAGELIFQHRCQPYGVKWKLREPNDSCGPRFKCFDLCEKAIDELGRAWRGDIYSWYSAWAWPEQGKFIGRWMLIINRRHAYDLDLEHGGKIAGGGDGQISHWSIIQGDPPQLVLAGQKTAYAFLTYDDRLGNWSDPVKDVHLTAGSPKGWKMGGTEGAPWDPFEHQVYADCVFRNEYRLGDLGGGLVIDVGGNVGCFVKAALEHGAGHVLTIEPIASNFEKLKANVEQFCDPAKVTAIQAAAWRSDVPATTLHALMPNGATHSGGYTVMHDVPGEAVQALPFDEILCSVIDESGPSLIRFLKLDCEGAEFPILYTTKYLPIVQEIALECHEKPELSAAAMVPEAPPYTGEAMAEFLRGKGFEVERIERVPGLSMIFGRRHDTIG